VSIRCTVKSDPADGVVRVADAARTKSPRFTWRRATTRERRNDLRIGEQCLDLLHGCGRNVDLVGREVAVRLRNTEIRLGDICISVHLIECPVADELPSLAQLFPVFCQGVLKRQVRFVVVQLAARAL
jgi:hypothetical protein